MFDPQVVANAGWGTPEEIAGVGYIVLVVATGGGYSSVYQVSNADELRRVTAQIERDDQEILAIIIAAVQVGVFP